MITENFVNYPFRLTYKVKKAIRRRPGMDGAGGGNALEFVMYCYSFKNWRASIVPRRGLAYNVADSRRPLALENACVFLASGFGEAGKASGGRRPWRAFCVTIGYASRMLYIGI